MLIRHSMARYPRAVAPDDLCAEALALFRDERIRHAPVVQDGRLVGVVTERDLMRALPGTVAAIDAEAGASARVSSVMARSPITCGQNEPIDLVAQRMERRKIGCMPVVEGNRLIGMVTSTDLLRGFTEHLGRAEARPVTLLWTGGRADGLPDVAALCVEAGLRVSMLLESEAESGARVFLLRVEGSDAAVSQWLSKCRVQGFGVLTSGAAA